MPPRMRRRITTAKREEIEAEQRLLDKQIVRPFETVEGLPISYNKPPHGHYEDVLKNPLTLKDSAVLYNSLIRSRNTYVFHAPMFKLYWVKQTAYAKKLAELEKGPQPAKERETRRRFAKATSNSLEAKTRTPILSGDVNARDVMSKLSEATLSLGPHSMEIRIFIAKDARSEKSKALSEISQVSDGSDLLMRKEALGPPPGPIPQPIYGQPPMTAPPPPGPLPGALPSAVPAPMSNSPTQPSRRTDEPPVTSDPLKKNDNTERGSNGQNLKPAMETEDTDDKLKEIDEKDSDKTDATKLNVKEKGSPQKRNTKGQVKGKSKTASVEAKLSKNDSKDAVTKEKNLGEETESKSDKSKSSDDKDSKKLPEKNTASTNQKPDAASSTSSASPAPAVGSQPNTAIPPSGVATGGFPRPPPPRAVDMTTVDNAIMISNLNAIAKIELSLNDLMKVVAKGTASEDQINLFKTYIEKAKQMGPQPHHAELYLVRGLPLPPNFPRPYPPKQYAIPRPPKPRFNNPLKLTAFQEKYLHNATLVFEFLENPNVRYVIPRDSICEVLPPANPITLEDGSGVRDVLISNIWIHNIEDVENYEKKLAEYNEEVRAKEEEERKKREEEEKAQRQEEEGEKKDDDSHTTEAIKEEPEELPARSSRSGRSKRAPPPRRKKPMEKPEEPPVRFTTYSFTLHGIPEKFVPIVVNSMRPMKLVQEKMEKILQIGTRVSSYHLWYQVDAKLDEGVAEDLRQSVILEEKKMTGVMPQSIEREPPKKRKREFKNPRPKKPKDESPSSMPPPQYASGSIPSSVSSTGIPSSAQIPAEKPFTA